MNTLLSGLLLWGLPLLIAVILHEIAHGYVALLCGDSTAKRAGRLTLNPLKHMDLLGSFLIPGILFLIQSPFLFGYAKPVPVDFQKLKHIKQDTLWVALAGPGTNVFLSIMGSLFLYTIPYLPGEISFFITRFLYNFILINGVLAVFNMLPFPPLDGSRILSVFLPLKLARSYNRLERYSVFILLALFLIPFITQFFFGTPINLLSLLIFKPTTLLLDGIGILTGQGS